MSCNDNWHFIRNLGSGGFGIVQLWENVRTRKKIAIKMCKENNTNLTQKQKERWTDEVNKLKYIDHPNIVKAEDLPYGVESKISRSEILPILCMEYCKKGDLRKVLNNVENCCGLKENDAFKAMSDISCAVAFLHSQGITHRDLKPENIVLQDMNGQVVYKLIDLGYAKDLGENSIYASIVGTLNYVAPELFWDKKYSRSVDYWSLGILFYEIACGRRPFLPKMQHTMTWMKYIKDKSVDEIRAYELNGAIIFKTDMEEPTHLSKCKKLKLTNWFKVALQIDPKKRGKDPKETCTENHKPRIIIFDLLHEILAKKVLHVFSVSLYKIFTYELDNSTTVNDIKQMLAKDTCISLDEQILTNNRGEILASDNEQLFACTVEPCCFIFENSNLSMKGRPSAEILPIIQGLINVTTTEENLHIDKVKNYYRSLIVLLQKEVDLFKLCLFALSIRVDLIDARIGIFKGNVQQNLYKARQIVNESKNIESYFKSISQDSAESKAFGVLSTKVEKLNTAANKIEKNLNDLEQRNEKLKNDARDINGISELTELYDEALSNFKECAESCKHIKHASGKMVQIVTQFLQIQRKKLFSGNMGNMGNILRQINEINSGISYSEEIFKSVVTMIPVYQKKLFDIKPANLNVILEPGNNPHLLTSSEQSMVVDNIIYENVVIRHTIDSLMEELQKKYFEVLNLHS